MRLSAVIVVCAVIALPRLSLADDVQYPGMLDYGIWPKSKTTDMEGHKFRIWFHPHKPFILIQPTIGGAFLGKFPHLDLEYWQAAAQAIVEPYGCKITDIAAKSKIGATWNAKYLCPDEKIINPDEEHPPQ